MKSYGFADGNGHQITRGRQSSETAARAFAQAQADSDDEAREIFAALYGRQPDDEDEAAGVWNLCCAAV